MTYDTLDAVDADTSALASAGALAEEALVLHRDALSILVEGWHGKSGCAAIDLIRSQCGDAEQLVAVLKEAASEFRSLRDLMTGDVLERTDSGSGDPAEPGDPQPDYARTAARLSDRSVPSFESPESPAAYPAPASFATPAMSWPSGGGPDIAGTLVGLVTQIADALTPEGVDTPPSEDFTDGVAPPQRADVTAEPGIPPPGPTLPAPAERVVPQPEPAQPPLQPPLPPPPSTPSPEQPLLAAELPREPESPPPVPVVEAPVVEAPVVEPPPVEPQVSAAESDVRSPCEIAADELPRVGE